MKSLSLSAPVATITLSTNGRTVAAVIPLTLAATVFWLVVYGPAALRRVERLQAWGAGWVRDLGIMWAAVMGEPVRYSVLFL
jgi:hypothetical protein